MTSSHDRWAAIVEDFDASGLTVLGFCEHRGVSAASFYRWRRLLRADRLSRPGPASFVEAVVRRAGTGHLESTEPADGAAPVVELGRRFRVAVPPGFDETTVARLLLLLERLGHEVPGGHSSASEPRR